ncbi:LEAF RUST 10 DISEASE-RESISTANCE LOCUS RECEPTOR-LIKE PROTEIN KINASE-like 1.2 [Iris pallida]|uniref:LEAF RUST 10 DISEASE-RESISTANCE LOCUS RECEPTOR-LIKE PROTEIN KINASE-like 1.2 n=2 Tax=Iris pallida TaxID=29817 RepID=A0AAX6IIU9_IRIPA|nr:LEAF RUST 10 DISEASE-RESISTANCE LOCUS RECEPTOR-LIKE PROTEIN KINASE-like 1.2 [Iris pallida]
MSTAITCFLFLYSSLLPLFAHSYGCPAYRFPCGAYNLTIQYPFYTTPAAGGVCPGIHRIQCINLVPLIEFQGQSGFLYPVWNISYPEKTLVIHDLRLSSYFRASDCVFLYDFSSPVPGFNLSRVSQSLNSSQPFFDCHQNTYDFSHDVFEELYNLTPCRDYSLFYSSSDYQSLGVAPSYCSTSDDLWFDWKLSYGDGEEDGSLSLLSAGFSRKWTPFPNCFSCGKIGVNCSGNGGGQPSCGCRNQCWGSKPSSKSHHSWRIVVGVIVLVVGFVVVCTLCFFCYRRKLRQRLHSLTILGRNSSSNPPSKELESISFHCQTPLFSYEELEEATKGFDRSEELGDGGYGTVYKGVLRDGRTVAVKRLYETNYKRVEQFVNEVEILSRLRHPNLVTLYGCTSPNSPHLLLVYEYIPNGTLADHLHDPLRSRSLPISLRLSMAIDAAAALSYLHSVDIIHRDVKTHNILVDQNYNVKVADFGLSRLFPTNATHISTAPQGTPGYLDPEYHRFYQLTDKSDVYSYGVVLMELLSSRPAVDVGRQPNEISLAMMSISKIQKGELDQIVDPALNCGCDQEVSRAVTQIAELAFRCLQMDREMRPSIKEVVEELREILKALCCRGEVTDAEAKVRDDIRLLKETSSTMFFSPKSVIDKWLSRSTMPNLSK